jgi:hypothetical protein
MILAGVLLKLGAYGFIRLSCRCIRSKRRSLQARLAVLAVGAIVFGAFGSFGQTDFKRLVAYSSVNHMGFVVLGIAAAGLASGTADAHIAMSGAVLQMFNHGLSAAGMFFLVGVIYERTHTRNLNEFGGLFPLVPIYGGILIFTSMASLGIARSQWLCIRIHGGTRRVSRADHLHRHCHAWSALHGRVYPQGHQKCPARTHERTLGTRRTQTDRDQHARTFCHCSAYGADAYSSASGPRGFSKSSTKP